MTETAEKNGKKIPKWVTTIAVLIPVVSSAGAAWYSLIAGDPEAQVKAKVAEAISKKTWRTLSRQANASSLMINKLHLRVVQFQAKEEERTAMTLQRRIEELEKLLKEKTSRKSSLDLKIRQALEKERARRVAAEQHLLRKFRAARGMKKLRQLPAKLDEAAKK